MLLCLNAMLMATTMLNKKYFSGKHKNWISKKKALSSVWGSFVFGMYYIKLIQSYIFPINGIITKVFLSSK